MVDRDVNPLEQRHLLLSARFKAAWAFHQLLMSMQRLSSGGEFENRSDEFQSLFGRIKKFAESLHGPTTGLDERSTTEIGVLEREVRRLFEELERQEERIAPSQLRRFFSQVKALDDRILIEVVRFYLEIQQDRDWSRDRLDKIDFLLSRLAEKIAGPNLKADRRRLDRVLEGLLTSAKPALIPDQELENLISTLQDLRSEVRWVKTFEELNESRRLEVYRALKQEMAGRIFHPRILPLVVEVNNAFRRRIDELRGHEELRLIEDYQKLSQLQEQARPQGAELQAELTSLQDEVERFRDRAKSDNVRISELVKLGDALRNVAARLEMQSPAPTAVGSDRPPLMTRRRRPYSGSSGLAPDLDCLEPHWSELMSALSGLGNEIAAEQARSETSLAAFRLESREIVAFRRSVVEDSVEAGPEQFILAAASLRRRICEEVEELRGQQSQTPGSKPAALLMKARETSRIADAYLMHFSHLIHQAVLDEHIEDARELQILQTRLQRESSGLSLMLPRRSEAQALVIAAPPTGDVDGEEVVAIPRTEPDPFGKLGEL